MFENVSNENLLKRLSELNTSLNSFCLPPTPYTYWTTTTTTGLDSIKKEEPKELKIHIKSKKIKFNFNL